MAKNPKMKTDEMCIDKAMSCYVNEDTVLIVTQQHHIEDDPTTGKGDKSKSRYRFMARICKESTLKEYIEAALADQHRLEPWMWPNDPSWKGKTMTANDSTRYREGRWLSSKLAKAVSWEDGQQILKGDKYLVGKINPKAAYDVEGFKADDGTKVNLTDREALLKYVGQNLWKPIILKTVQYPQEFTI